jgi:hypothetical protein
MTIGIDETRELFSLFWKNLEAQLPTVFTVLEKSGSSASNCFHCFGKIWKLSFQLFSLFWKNLEAQLPNASNSANSSLPALGVSIALS